MPGYAFAFGPCAACGATFGFDPTRVPSTRVNGKKEPICRHCLAWINAERRGKKLEPFTAPAGAYAACPEEELR